MFFIVHNVYSRALLLCGELKTYLWRFMGENDPLFSSWKCSGFAMTMTLILMLRDLNDFLNEGRHSTLSI